MKIDVSINEAVDVVTICGIRYSGDLFRQMALAEPGTWLRIEGRKDGTLSVTCVNDETGRTFDLLTGKGPLCVS